jgi:hypothetical protein
MPSADVVAGAEHPVEKSGLTLVRLPPYAGSDAVDGSAQDAVEYELTSAQ